MKSERERGRERMSRGGGGGQRERERDCTCEREIHTVGDTLYQILLLYMFGKGRHTYVLGVARALFYLFCAILVIVTVQYYSSYKHRFSHGSSHACN